MPQKKRRVLCIDDDDAYRSMIVQVFKSAGYEAHECGDSTQALKEVKSLKPHFIITDLMMPGVDGMELLKQFKADEKLKNIKVIILSGKSYEFDKNRAFELGADGYLMKSTPIEDFLKKFEEIVFDKLTVHIWGARGTLPVPGEETLRYGGNTCCVSVQFARDNFFIFDAGTGIRMLSNHVLKNNIPLKRSKIFISHPHWDHINAFPFFAPLYIPGNDFEILGAAHGDIDIEGLLSHQMDGVYFPIKLKEFGAHLEFKNLNAGEFETDGVKVSTMLLNHPGNCLGYRLDYKGKSFCYITDNEIYPEDSPSHDPSYFKRLIEFTEDADILITDCCYRDEEYPKKINWGHSAPQQVTKWAHKAKVKDLYLFHHDPSQNDDAIDEKLKQAQAHLKKLKSKTQVHVAAEGASIDL